jgi:hypothetical protein
MTRFTLDARVRLAIELALTAGSRDPSRLRLQEAEARKLGMTGAEIDAARRGTSFEVLVSLAVGLATAAGAGDEKRLLSARNRALKAGIAEHICAEIEDLSNSVASSFSKDPRHRP